MRAEIKHKFVNVAHVAAKLSEQANKSGVKEDQLLKTFQILVDAIQDLADSCDNDNAANIMKASRKKCLEQLEGDCVKKAKPTVKQKPQVKAVPAKPMAKQKPQVKARVVKKSK